MLTVSDLSKSFDHDPVLLNIGFSINTGEMIGLVGKNGAGKSTLLRILSRITTPNSGIIEYKKNNILNVDSIHRKGIYYCGHAPGFYPSFTGFENIQFFSSIHNRSVNEERINEVLELFGLINDSSKQVKYYSQGMTQRLKLALVDIVEWDLLLIDEPFNGLDIQGIKLVSEKLKSWQDDQKSTIFVDHDIGRALDHASRILILSDHQLALDESTDSGDLLPTITQLMN